MVKMHLSVIYNVLKLNNALRVTKPVILVKITMVCYVHIFILNNAVITIDSTIFFMLSSSQLPRLFWSRPTKYKENVKVYYHYRQRTIIIVYIVFSYFLWEYLLLLNSRAQSCRWHISGKYTEDTNYIIRGHTKIQLHLTY